MEALIVIGRVFFGLYIVYSGAMPLPLWKNMVPYVKMVGLPLPPLSNAIAAALLLFGGVSVALGWMVPLGAASLVLFLGTAAVFVHRFWGLKDQMTAGNQKAHFLKNCALISALLILAGFGPGPAALG
jgi:putative oxidoreductase